MTSPPAGPYDVEYWRNRTGEPRQLAATMMLGVAESYEENHRNIQNTTRYTALAPDRFKSFWRD